VPLAAVHILARYSESGRCCRPRQGRSAAVTGFVLFFTLARFSVSGRCCRPRQWRSAAGTVIVLFHIWAHYSESGRCCRPRQGRSAAVTDTVPFHIPRCSCRGYQSRGEKEKEKEGFETRTDAVQLEDAQRHSKPAEKLEANNDLGKCVPSQFPCGSGCVCVCVCVCVSELMPTYS